MDSQNIFDIFGRQIITSNVVEIETLKEEMSDNTNKLINNLNNRIDNVDKLTEVIKLDKNYISFNKKRRIVGVKPSIDKHDVVIKEQIEKPLILSNNIDIVDSNDPNIKSSLSVKGRRISEVSKGINPFDVIIKSQLDEVIKDFDDFKLEFDQLKQNYESFKQNVKNFVNETSEDLANINTKLDNKKDKAT